MKAEAYLQDANIQYDARLREKSGGDWEGEPLGKFASEAKNAGCGIREFAAPNGECWKDVNSRARDFIVNDIIKNYFRVGTVKDEKEDGK